MPAQGIRLLTAFKTNDYLDTLALHVSSYCLYTHSLVVESRSYPTSDV